MIGVFAQPRLHLEVLERLRESIGVVKLNDYYVAFVFRSYETMTLVEWDAGYSESVTKSRTLTRLNSMSG